MDTDPYSLDALRDIVVPAAPSWWPPAPGAWIALGLVAALTLLLARHLLARSRRNAYRRAGLALLAVAGTRYEVSVTLKRVAMAAFPREQVASLYGDAWTAFLASSCPGEDFAALGNTATTAAADPEFIRLARTWIRHHRASENQPAEAR